jgi:hypothetical protein
MMSNDTPRVDPPLEVHGAMAGQPPPIAGDECRVDPRGVVAHHVSLAAAAVLTPERSR